MDSFLSTKFPDPGTDDLNLAYVIKNFPLVGVGFLTATLISVLLGFRWKRYAYFGIAILFANITFFTLMRSNFEFYYWMITGPQPGYGGLATGMSLLFIFVFSIGWLVVDNAFFCLEQKKKDQSRALSYLYKIYNFATLCGIVFTVIFSLFHFGPVIAYVIKNGW